MKRIPKILLSILTTAVLLFGGFVVLIIVALSGGLAFHQVMVAAAFFAITVGTDNPNIDTLIEWILSEQGQYLVEKTGYTPMQ